MSGASVALVASHVRYEEREIIAALERRGVPYEHVDDRRLIFRLGEPPPSYRVVLNRCISQTRRLHLSRLFEAGGVPVSSSSRVISTCDDRVAMHLALAGAGLPLPPTAVALAAEHGVDAIETVGYPAVVKPVGGSWGRLVAKVSERDAAEAVVEHRAALRSPQHGIVYAQAYVDKPGRDIRVLVVGDRVPAAMYRRSEHWVTNVARGAEVEPCPISPELRELALRAATSVGGGAVTIDLLETQEGELLVNEVNSLVEFRGLAAATGVDVAGEIVDHALDAVASERPRAETQSSPL
jgi:[lysine-biosynthesis-protein LysW]--L-2-aminoadipate ligase